MPFTNLTAERILERVRSFGVDAAEVFLRSSASTSIEVKEGAVDAFERAEEAGVGLRVLHGGRLGFAFATDLSDGSLNDLVRAAVTNAKNTDPDPFQAIPEAKGGYSSPDIYDPELESLTDKEKIERVIAMEREAFGVDPRIRRIRRAQAGFSVSETMIANTNGALISYKATACSSSIEVVAEEKGESQAGWDFDVSRFYRRLEIEAVARRAAQKAINLLGAKAIFSVKAPVILDRTVASEILSIMASGLSAENVQKKKSLFMGKLGRDVFSSLITVVDDGLLSGGMGTAPADDEGVPLSKKTVIEKGVLTMFLYNTYTAKKDKTVSTGNAVRGSFKGMPAVGVTNLYIEPGALSPEQVIAGTDAGLYVIEIMGAHTANPITGDFSVGATGFWIEKGKISHPVREITIAGNILDLMKNVDAVCNDLKFSGRIGSPTLRIKELSIAGK